jgi:hypothetical protein
MWSADNLSDTVIPHDKYRGIPYQPELPASISKPVKMESIYGPKTSHSPYNVFLWAASVFHIRNAAVQTTRGAALACRLRPEKTSSPQSTPKGPYSLGSFHAVFGTLKSLNMCTAFHKSFIAYNACEKYKISVSESLRTSLLETPSRL